MIDYTYEQLQELEQLKVTDEEIEILKRISLGTLPPSNLGRDDMILFQLTAYRDYELYFIKEQRLERLSYNSARNFMSNNTPIVIFFDKKHRRINKLDFHFDDYGSLKEEMLEWVKASEIMRAMDKNNTIHKEALSAGITKDQRIEQIKYNSIREQMLL